MLPAQFDVLEPRSLLTAGVLGTADTLLLTIDPIDTTAIGGTAVAASLDGRFVLLHASDQMVVGNDASLLILDTTTNGLTPIPGSDFVASPSSVQMSPDGRFVTFVSEQVQIYDRQTNSTQVLSQTPTDQDSTGTFFQTLVSDDGRFVAFTGEADDLIRGFVDGNGANGVDLFLCDRQTNDIVLVNHKAGKATTSSNAGSGFFIHMSNDGQRIFFNTFATDLAPNDSNGPQGSDIYLFNTVDLTVSLVSVTSTGAAAAIATSYTVSADGRYVAFDSFAADIVPGIPLPSHSHAYVRDVLLGTTQLVDHAADGSVLESDSTFPQITPDGRFVLFQDDGPFLTSPPITTLSSNVYVREMATSQIQLVSAVPDGSNAGDERSSVELSDHVQISANGRYVTFVSRASNLVAGFVDGNAASDYDLYVRDLQLGTTVLVSKNRQGTASGNRETSLVFASPFPFNDGRVLFSSPASDLSTTSDSNDVYDAFLANPFAPSNPTEFVGPAGFGPLGFRQPDSEPYSYAIHFENIPAYGFAAVKEVSVMHELDPDLDSSTLELGLIQFGDLTIHVPAGLQDYQTQVDYQNQDSSLLKVNVDVRLNLETGVVTWLLRSIDPETGVLPVGEEEGFLPINDANGSGAGALTYTIHPKSDLASGTGLTQQAVVVFDVNTAFETNVHINTLDLLPPVSTIGTLPASTGATAFHVSWSGSDSGGSGIASYDIYVADNDGLFQLWLDDTTQTSASYAGVDGHIYRFYSVATDHVGLIETGPQETEASTTVDEAPQVNIGSAAVGYTNKQPAIIVLPQITVGGASAAGGQLTISLTAAGTKKKPTDVVHFPATSSIGASAGPVYANGRFTLQVQLNDTVTESEIQSYLRGISFSTKGKGLKKIDRTMMIQLIDASGGQSPIALQSILVYPKSRRR